MSKKYDTLLELLEALDDDIVLVLINENGIVSGYEGADEIGSIDYYHPNKRVEKYEIRTVNRGGGYLIDIWIY